MGGFLEAKSESWRSCGIREPLGSVELPEREGIGEPIGNFQGKCWGNLRQGVGGLTGEFKYRGSQRPRKTPRSNLRAGVLALISALTLLFYSCPQTHCAENLLKADTYRKWRAAKAGEKSISVVLQVILPSPYLLLTRGVETQGADSAEPNGSGLSHSPF